MDRIVCLVGASGSGKTTIAKELDKLGYNIIHSYTTRKPRVKNEWGHIFIDETWEKGEDKTDILFFRNILDNEVIREKNIIAFFNDYSKNEIYFATENQYKNKGTSIYVVDPKGAEQVKTSVKDAEIITIFLMADENLRYRRMYERIKDNFIKTWGGSISESEKTDMEIDIYDRIESDEKIFSTCKCDYVVNTNRNIEEILADIKRIIGDVNE